MTAASTPLLALYPAFTSKDDLIDEIRQEIEPNSPNAKAFLFRLAHTDLAGSLTNGANLNAYTDFGL